jgi:signal transduction histidine kinase/DNA-binding response OmpR family regulator
MKTILVLAPHPELVEAIRAGLPPEQYRVVSRVSIEEAEPLLAHGMADICVLDHDLNGVQGSWLIEKIRRKAPAMPLVVIAGVRQPEWEEDACLKGVKQVFGKPFRPRLFEAVLQQLDSTSAPAPQRSPAPATAFAPPEPQPSFSRAAAAGGPHQSLQSLQVLRDFSTILTHSLEAGALLRQFLLLMRELTGVNRASIFLRSSAASFLGADSRNDSQMLTAACGIGLSNSVMEVVKLSFNSGIGSHIHRLGRIVRRTSPEAADAETQREFELLGAQVAVPILDREQILGVALFDARVTGEPMANAELELVFHLLEQVGLAVKNIRLHDQVAANHEMLADVMRELSSACIVVNRDLAVLHANRMAKKYFGQTGARSGELEFTDLPAALGSKVFQVLKTGSALAPFRYTPEDEPGSVYQVTISPVHRAGSATPNSVLLMVEDRTQAEQLRKLEHEATVSKHEAELLQSMSRQLAAEIGNGITPVGVYAELMKEQFKDAGFRERMEGDLKKAVTRVNRFVEQMRYLGGKAGDGGQSFPLAPLIEEAWKEAQKYQPVKTAKLVNNFADRPVLITGDRQAIRHAISEVLLNALQSNPEAKQVEVRCQETDSASEPGTICIEVQDNGPGFTPEAQAKAGTPFYTTRIPAVGLGLLVTRRIVESNHGKVEIPRSGQHGIVQIVLPVQSAAGK